MFGCLFISIFYNVSYLYEPSQLQPSLNVSNANTSNYRFWLYCFPNQIYLLQFLFSVFTTIVFMVYNKSELKRMNEKFLTVKNKLLLSSASKIVSLSSIANNSKVKEEIEISLPNYFIVSLWITHTIIISLSFSVTVLFLFNEISNQFYLNGQTNFALIWSFFNFNVFNSVITSIEFLLTLIPLRLYQFYLPLTVAFFHIFIRFAIDSFIEWSNVLSILPLVLVIHILSFLSFRLKMWILISFSKKKSTILNKNSI